MGQGSISKKGRSSDRTIDWILLSLILLFVITIRLHLLGVPLERDEGEYAYMGQLLLKGVSPYDHAYSMKFPGTFVIYAIVMAVFGERTEGIHLGLMIANVLSTILVYFLGKRFTGRLGSLLAAGVYSILSLSPSVEGNSAHATQFMILPVLGGTLILLGALDRQDARWQFFLSGFLMGLGVIIKQHAAFFVLYALILIFADPMKRVVRISGGSVIRRAALYAAGIILIIGGTFFWLESTGEFNTFWLWTVHYAFEYLSQVPLAHVFDIFVPRISRVIDSFYILWGFSLLGFLVAIRQSSSSKQSRLLLVFAIISFATVCPGFYFREHYFVSCLPSIAFLTAVFAEFVRTKLGRYVGGILPSAITTGVVLVAIIVGIAGERDFFLGNDDSFISRRIYGLNPFPEAVNVANFVATRSDSSDRIAVLGSEPEIFFYSGRMSATGYIYTYGLMEDQPRALDMQNEMIGDIESSRPRFIIAVSSPGSWGRSPNSQDHIFRWMSSFIPQNYVSVAVADILSPSSTKYVWDDEKEKYEIRGSSAIRVFMRKPPLAQ